MTEDANKKEEYAYDSYGLFLGLISYPFDKDGKKIYEDLDVFFKEHKERLRKYDPSEESDLTEFNNYLYKPAGYRMFGSQGLAVLSLVDDYAFPIRYFDKDHIQTLFEEAGMKSNDKTEVEEIKKMYFDGFHSVAVMGVTERKEGEASIIQKAEASFLNEKSRFPFIGIIRLKIKSQKYLLADEKGEKGIKTIRLIRDQIDKLSGKDGVKKKPEAKSFHITMECYDNDEMTVVAFSDSLLYLFNFLGEIRSMTNMDLEAMGFPKGEKESHVFGSTLISFGYDVKQEDNDDFRKKLQGFNMKCVIETKSGHRDSLFKFLEDKTNKHVEKLGITSVVKNMTGGCNIIATMPLANILELENLCCLTNDNNDNIKRDVKKMKVVLEDCDNGRIESEVKVNHGGIEFVKGIENAKDMKELMKEVGISKPLRDSMLSLYELFNTANEDILQRTYLKELKGTLGHFYEELQQKYVGGYPISEIEESLDVEIRNMENAIYDRLHLQKRVQAPLEYSCGIQQYLTSFNYAYSKTSRFFNSHEVYVTITGAERGSSVANSFNLNINEILYPELFITLLWKEIGNFSLLIIGEPISEKEHDKETQRHLKIINSWRNLTENKKSYDILLNDIIQSPALLDNSLTSRIVINLLMPELLLYFFKDNVVCHSLFDGDFKMMWHFYLKTLLQTSVCYEKLNQMKREHFIHMLLRLFIVAKLNKEETFVREQMEKPFDSLIGSLWFEHYGKTWEIAEVIYEVLEKFDFYEVSRLLAVYAKISMLFDNNQDNDEDWDEMIRARASFADKIQSQFEGGQLIEEGRGEFGFIISLFLAYMKEIYSMDNNGNRLIKSLPRDEKGCVDEFLVKEEKNKYFDNAVALIADPTGGFFVPLAAHRKKYFLYRTVLYRSLWNIRYTDPLN